MASLNLADTFVTFLAVLGPQKVLLFFARIARTRDPRTVRLVAVATAASAACIGTVCTLTAPWLVTFFHISAAALELSAGILFFIYAVGLVLGIHFDLVGALTAPSTAETSETSETSEPGGTSEIKASDPLHPLSSGFREMLLPFVVSPLGVAAAILASVSASGWHARWGVVIAFALVVLIDMVTALLFSVLLSRVYEIVLEMLSRLLGILLAAVGVQLFLQGLDALGVLPSGH